VSFGMTQAVVECHVADLHQHANGSRKMRAGAGRTRPDHGLALSLHLRHRIGLTLVEMGLHLLVQAREPTRPVPTQGLRFRPSSVARGR
jgi:hypothetical protein